VTYIPHPRRQKNHRFLLSELIITERLEKSGMEVRTEGVRKSKKEG